MKIFVGNEGNHLLEKYYIQTFCNHKSVMLKLFNLNRRLDTYYSKTIIFIHSPPREKNNENK